MTPLDYLAKEYVELTMVKQRYDSDDVYFFVDRPFWKRDSLNFSHEYKFAPGTPVPEYPARSLNNISSDRWCRRRDAKRLSHRAYGEFGNAYKGSSR